MNTLVQLNDKLIDNNNNNKNNKNTNNNNIDKTKPSDPIVSNMVEDSLADLIPHKEQHGAYIDKAKPNKASLVLNYDYLNPENFQDYVNIVEKNANVNDTEPDFMDGLIQEDTRRNKSRMHHFIKNNQVRYTYESYLNDYRQKLDVRNARSIAPYETPLLHKIKSWIKYKSGFAHLDPLPVSPITPSFAPLPYVPAYPTFAAKSAEYHPAGGFGPGENYQGGYQTTGGGYSSAGSYQSSSGGYRPSGGSYSTSSAGSYSSSAGSYQSSGGYPSYSPAVTPSYEPPQSAYGTKLPDHLDWFLTHGVPRVVPPLKPSRSFMLFFLKNGDISSGQSTSTTTTPVYLGNQTLTPSPKTPYSGTFSILAESRPGRNIAFSPYGLASVSMLLYEGASGTSALQLSQALQLPYDAVYARVGFRDLYRHLRRSGDQFSAEEFFVGLIFRSKFINNNIDKTKPSDPIVSNMVEDSLADLIPHKEQHGAYIDKAKPNKASLVLNYDYLNPENFQDYVNIVEKNANVNDTEPDFMDDETPLLHKIKSWIKYKSGFAHLNPLPVSPITPSFSPLPYVPAYPTFAAKSAEYHPAGGFGPGENYQGRYTYESYLNDYRQKLDVRNARSIAPFHEVPPGSTQTSFTASHSFVYFVVDNFTKVSLLAGIDEKYKLLILLPSSTYGLNSLLKALPYCSIRAIYAQLRYVPVYATLPVFDIAEQISLTSTLQQLGVNDIFYLPKADLSTMSSDSNLFVRDIMQVVAIYAKKYNSDLSK
ncbi:uncharacterized protein LOC103509957 [Diaphorina citri]|uniref:Uncharacterized protein LOC103509957 n=1 Tax=Diaphorina citri TaxID=121845 RepID=A0A1S3D3R7_DIACI|nr:uncharacterized protein LOC103509957 [Diaphorina citri]